MDPGLRGYRCKKKKILTAPGRTKLKCISPMFCVQMLPVFQIFAGGPLGERSADVVVVVGVVVVVVVEAVCLCVCVCCFMVCMV